MLHRCRCGDKQKITRAVPQVFLSPLIDQLTEFWKLTALQMLQHLFSSYMAIDKINLEEKIVKMMGPYNPIEHLARFIDQLKKGAGF